MLDESDLELDDEQLSVAVKALRVVAGLSQREVADRSSLHHTIVSKIEAGSKFPTLEELRSYLRAVGATGEELDLMLFLVRRMKSPDTRSAVRVTVEETGERVDTDEFAEIVGRALAKGLRGVVVDDLPPEPVRPAAKAKAN